MFENFYDHRTCTDKSSTVGGAVCRTGMTPTNTHTHKEEKKKTPTLLAPSAGLHFFVDRRPVCLWTGAGTRTRTTLGPNIPHVWTLLLPHFHRRHQELCETNQATLCSPLTTSTGTSDSSVPEFRLPQCGDNVNLNAPFVCRQFSFESDATFSCARASFRGAFTTRRPPITFPTTR